LLQLHAYRHLSLCVFAILGMQSPKNWRCDLQYDEMWLRIHTAGSNGFVKRVVAIYDADRQSRRNCQE